MMIKPLHYRLVQSTIAYAKAVTYSASPAILFGSFYTAQKIFKRKNYYDFIIFYCKVKTTKTRCALIQSRLETQGFVASRKLSDDVIIERALKTKMHALLCLQMLCMRIGLRPRSVVPKLFKSRPTF